MNLAIDYGNTRGKAGLFEGSTLSDKIYFKTADDLSVWIKGRAVEHIIVSSVVIAADEIISWVPFRGRSLQLTHSLPLPVNVQYATPDTLGVDRIAAVCGALDLFPNQDCLVIDAGTCITYEFLDANSNYLGGAISPGLRMRFESVHEFTARLPLVEPVANPSLTGKSTEECIQSGVVNGMMEEIKGIMARYKEKYPNLRVALCGGDSRFFENVAKPSIFVAPDLVLSGLNRILLHNVK